MQSEPLSERKLVVASSHGCPSPKSQVPNMTWIPTGQHFMEVRLGLGLVLRVGWSKTLDQTLNTSPVNTFAYNNHDFNDN